MSQFKTNVMRTDLRQQRDMKKINIIKLIRIFFQFIGLIILRLLYQPLNRYLVDIYGCSCKEGFNTNSINKIIFIIFFFIQIFISIINIKIYKTKRIGILMFIISTIIILLISNSIYWSLMWK